jgi:hypothetical protein
LGQTGEKRKSVVVFALREKREKENNEFKTLNKNLRYPESFGIGARLKSLIQAIH